jgi:hypothetical protein
LPEAFRPCFTTPTFTTFVTLLTGIFAKPANRTVCGMLAGAGMARVWHHTGAHRIFAAAGWHPDTVDVAALRLIAGHLVPMGHHCSWRLTTPCSAGAYRKVHAAHWGYDGGC